MLFKYLKKKKLYIINFLRYDNSNKVHSFCFVLIGFLLSIILVFLSKLIVHLIYVSFIMINKLEFVSSTLFWFSGYHSLSLHLVFPIFLPSPCE